VSIIDLLIKTIYAKVYIKNRCSKRVKEEWAAEGGN
jgi:hypothetical protein